MCALHRAWAACAPITGWDRTFGKDAPKRVANGPFAHNKGRPGCDSALAPITLRTLHADGVAAFRRPDAGAEEAAEAGG